MSQYLGREEKQVERKKRALSLGLIFALPDPVISIEGTQLKHKLKKKNNNFNENNKSEALLLKQYEKQLQKAIYESRKEKYMNSLAMLAQKKKQKEPSFNPVVRSSRLFPPTNNEECDDYLTPKKQQLKSISILNKTIFATEINRRKKQEPLELSISKLPIVTKRGHRSTRGKKSQQKRKKLERNKSFQEKQKPKKYKSIFDNSQIKGWDIKQEIYI